MCPRSYSLYGRPLPCRQEAFKRRPLAAAIAAQQTLAAEARTTTTGRSTLATAQLYSVEINDQRCPWAPHRWHPLHNPASGYRIRRDRRLELFQIDESPVNQHQSTDCINGPPGTAVRVMTDPGQAVAPQFWKIWKDRACHGFAAELAAFAFSAGSCSPSASAAPSASRTARTPGTLRRSR